MHALRRAHAVRGVRAVTGNCAAPRWVTCPGCRERKTTRLVGKRGRYQRRRFITHWVDGEECEGSGAEVTAPNARSR